MFYPYLSNLRKNSKNRIFDTFWTYLESLNVVTLREMAHFLGDKNISIGNFALIEQYIQKVKMNPSKFCKLLTEKIA